MSMASAVVEEPMTRKAAKTEASYVLTKPHLEQLLQSLADSGYKVIGPTVRDGAIVYEPLNSIDQLPAGWTDEQQAGKYRLRRRQDNALFGYVVGPHSWKKFLYPPARRLWQAERRPKGFRLVPEEPAKTRYAFVGVRACELHAIALQDEVLLHGQYPDPDYQ